MAPRQLDQPIPFEIVEGADGITVATNGRVRLVAVGEGRRVFRRRGLKGVSLRPAAEMVLPQLNALAGELLQRPDMPPQDVVGRLLAMAGTVPVDEPQRVEWAVAELAGVLVYTDGVSIIVTTQDLTP